MSDSNNNNSEEGMPGLEDTSDDESDSGWEMDRSDDAACMATIADDIKKKQHSHTKAIVHTPASWHNLMHTSKLLSEVTTKQSKAHFIINSKTKLGTELNSADLAALEGAHADCKASKQTKLTALSTSQSKGHTHASYRLMLAHRSI